MSNLATGICGPMNCDHCGQSLDGTPVTPHDREKFCCNGCAMAYQFIVECGLEKYYDLRKSQDMAATSPRPQTANHYLAYDEPAFYEKHCDPIDQCFSRVELYLEGIHCASCVWLLEKLPAMIAGVRQAQIDLKRSLIVIEWQTSRIRLSQIAHVLARLGYIPYPVRASDNHNLTRLNRRRDLIRIAIAGAVAGNIMLMAIPLYAGAFSGIDAEWVTLFRWGSMAMAMISLAGPGRVFFRGAWSALITRAPTLDLPIALGLGVGMVSGIVNTLMNQGDIYFDSLTILVFLLLVGRFIHRAQLERSMQYIDRLYAYTPLTCRIVKDGVARDIPLTALQTGDELEVRAGETIGADSQVESGQSTIDESWLTGEAQPRPVSKFSWIYAGTLNLSSRLRLRVKAVGELTRMGKLMKSISQMAYRKTPMVQLTDRIARRFIVAVLGLALVNFMLWMTVDVSHAIDTTVALLIVACPCALGLATPLTFALAIGQAARRMILMKRSDAFEYLAKPGIIYLDKTGTLTEGRYRMVHWHGDDAIKPLVAAVERHSAHPAARILTADFPDGEDISASEVVQHADGGISGIVGHDLIHIGSPAFITAQGIALPDWAQKELATAVSHACTPIAIAVNGIVAATAALGDSIRSDTTQSLSLLQQWGWQLGILSGDHQAVATGVGVKVGIPAVSIIGDLTPEQKLEKISEDYSNRTIVMVGDGVNDAGALAAATVGIAVHGGAEAGMTAANIYIHRPGVGAVVELIAAARRTMAIVYRNLTISLSYNFIAILLAINGAITPLVAAILMPISSLTVIIHTLMSSPFRR